MIYNVRGGNNAEVFVVIERFLSDYCLYENRVCKVMLDGLVGLFQFGPFVFIC